MTNQELATVLAGVARTNIALVRAVTDQQAFLVGAIPAMQAAAGVPPAAPVTLSNIFARMTLQAFDGAGPDVAFYAAELDRLTASQ